MKFGKTTRAALLLALLAGTVQAAYSDESHYPERPIHMVVAVAPGGALDATVRIVARALGEELKQAVIVENKPGGGSLLGYRYAKNARPDGYTLLAASSSVVMLPWLRNDPGYDPLKDLKPVSPMEKMPFILVTSPLTHYHSLHDILEKAKKNPQSVTYASAGFGSTTYLAAAKMFRDAGVQARHIPYNGNGAAMPDVLAGRVQLLFEEYGVAYPHLAAGKLVALGITTKTRAVEAPNIPPLAEQGVPNYDYAIWNGIFAPAGTPDAIVGKLNAAMEKVLKKPAVVKYMRAAGDEPMPLSVPAFATFVKTEYSSLGKLIQELHIPKQ